MLKKNKKICLHDFALNLSSFSLNRKFCDNIGVVWLQSQSFFSSCSSSVRLKSVLSERAEGDFVLHYMGLIATKPVFGVSYKA